MFKLSKRTKIVIAAIIIIIVTFSIGVFSQFFIYKKTDLIRVACLGDSNTENIGYPEYLQELLGESKYLVHNFGIGGATVNLQSSKPYYYELDFQEVKNFDPTIVILMLGTNDARADRCSNITSFTDDYTYLITQIQRQTNVATLFLVIPPPIFDNDTNLNSTFFVDEIIPRIQQIATEKNLPLIDLYTPLRNHPEYIPDGVHPNPEGTQIITQIIYEKTKSV